MSRHDLVFVQLVQESYQADDQKKYGRGRRNTNRKPEQERIVHP